MLTNPRFNIRQEKGEFPRCALRRSFPNGIQIALRSAAERGSAWRHPRLFILRMPAHQPPWFDTGLRLEAGERVTTFARGRTCLDEPIFGLALISKLAPHRRAGTNLARHGAGNTFAAEPRAAIFRELFPRRMVDADGELATPPEHYDLVSAISPSSSSLARRSARRIARPWRRMRRERLHQR